MKTHKVLFASLLLFILSISSSFAQPASNGNKTVDQWIGNFSTYVPCVEETISGDLQVTITTWGDSKQQIKFKGTMTGEISGNIYTISQVSNDNWLVLYDGNPPFNATFVVTFVVELNGMPVATEHDLWHVTRNANGVRVTYFEHYFFNCY